MALKILHTADWHLGQTFFGYDREEEHAAFLSWLTELLLVRRIDVLLIAGDVFDVSNPSANAQHCFFRFLKEVTTRNPLLQILVIAGNHDSAARLEAPAPLLEELNTHIAGIIKRKDDSSIDFDHLLVPLKDGQGVLQAWCMTVPYLRQSDYPAVKYGADTYVAGVSRMYNQLYQYALEKKDPGHAVIAMGHLHASGAELSGDDRSERVIMGGLESVPVTAFHHDIVYTALGHIHKAQKVGGRDAVRYAGSPLPMSFSEKGYNHQVLYVEVEGSQLSVVESICIPRTIELLRIPPEPLASEVVLSHLEALPERDGSTLAPFLEVRVLLSEPEPSFRHKVEEIVQHKQVRLGSIVPVYLQKENQEQQTPLSFDDFQKMEPLDMLKRAFSGKYGAEMPEAMQILFSEVMHELNLNSEFK